MLWPRLSTCTTPGRLTKFKGVGNLSKVIVLASGGLDSSLVMAKLLKEGHYVVPLFTDYGQYSVEGERKAVRDVVQWLKSCTGVSGHSPGSYEGGSITIYPGTLEDVVEVKVDIGQRVAACPGRVLAFVGAAAIWSYTEDWDEGSVAIGIHAGDKDQDSCRVGYEDSLNETLKSLTQSCLQIITPLMGMSRKDMAKEISEMGIPWEIMYNCYWSVACGSQSENMRYRCPGCRRKQESMELAGRPESEWSVPNKSFGSRDVARRDWKYA